LRKKDTADSVGKIGGVLLSLGDNLKKLAAFSLPQAGSGTPGLVTSVDAAATAASTRAASTATTCSGDCLRGPAIPFAECSK